MRKCIRTAGYNGARMQSRIDSNQKINVQSCKKRKKFQLEKVKKPKLIRLQKQVRGKNGI